MVIDGTPSSYNVEGSRIKYERKMVIDGNKLDQTGFAAVNFEDDRIRLPSGFAERAHLAGDESIACWLLVVTVGRYRLVPQPAGSATGTLGRILEQWEEAGAAGDVLDSAGSNERAGIRARLISTRLSPRGPGWRITVPKEAKLLVPTGEDRSFVFVLVVAGFIELWFPDTLRRALSMPIAELFD